jgi:hypothetical protein
LPIVSVAVTVTGVVPTGKVLPLAGEYVTVGVPRLSVALAPLSGTMAPLAEVALTLIVPGTVSSGGVVSTELRPENVPMLEAEARPLARRKP